MLQGPRGRGETLSPLLLLAASRCSVATGIDGGMADEVVEEVGAEGGERAAGGSNPEKGSTGAASSLQKLAEKTLEEHLADVMKCVVGNIKDKHLPSAKLLIDLAARLKADEDVPETAYTSLAQVLWTACPESVRKELGFGAENGAQNEYRTTS